MNDRSDLDVRLTAWLREEAPIHAPERLVHATREQVATTRPMGAWRRLGVALPVWESRPALVAAVLALAVIAGALSLNLLARSAQQGATGPTPIPTLTTLSPYPCPPRQGTCRGSLAAGVYSSTSFLPRIRYSVPAGWENTLDTRGQLDLTWSAGGSYRYPDGTVFHDGVSIFRRPLAASATVNAAAPGIGTTARELAQWLGEHVDVQVSGLVPVTVGGAPGYRLDVAIPSTPRTSPDHCVTDHGLSACESLFVGGDPSGRYGFGIVGPEQALIYLVRAPDGGTVMVVVDDVDGVDRDALLAAAAPIVESLEFVP